MNSEDSEPLPEAELLTFAPLSPAEPALVAAVEALLFASGEPVGTRELAAVLDVGREEVRAAIAALQDRHRGEASGLRVVRVAGAWQLRTAVPFAGVVMALRGGKPAKLSRAALEVLAVVAYEQPVTKHEIEGLRGVDSGGVLRTLLDRDLVRIAGRRDEPGRPLEYATTRAFLEMFSLRGLDDLPSLRERAELATEPASDGTPVRGPRAERDLDPALDDVACAVEAEE